MKKTININLAGTFFHIDEDAYGKLSRYLDAIRKSLTDPQGSEEIIRDIEARIAELFSEKIENSTQVISLKELDQVITVMGQPEDYMVDEEIFDDTPPSASKRSRTRSGNYNQLFRDIDNKFIAGVSSGLGHYFKVDSLWIRLIWILLTFLSSGFFIIVYVLFWILVPAAVTVSDKLRMNREAVNISNIEKKFKEGYDAVADGVKNADYDKYGKQIKKGTSGFFETLGTVFVTLFKIFVKLFGVLLVITSIATLVGLIVGLFTVGSLGFIDTDGDFMEKFHIINTSDLPLWLMSLLLLFAVGIPFIALLILGLKILIKNLKSIGITAKLTLAIVWFTSIIALTIIGIKQATQQAYDGDFITEEVVPIGVGERLKLEMVANNQYASTVYRRGGFKIKYNENDEKVLYNTDIRLIVRSTKDSIGRILIERQAEGQSLLEAKKHAEAITYNYAYANGVLSLDGYFLTDPAKKYHDQEIEIILYLPEGSILYADENTNSYHLNSNYYRDILESGDEEMDLLIENDKTVCLNCPREIEEEEIETNLEEKTEPIIDSTNTQVTPKVKPTSTSKSWEEEVNDSHDQ